MSELLGIPVPSVEQIVVGAELVVILYPIKRMVANTDRNTRLLRNYIIERHVKSGHEDRLKHCAEGQCPNLQRSSELPFGLQPELEADLL